MPLIVFKHFFFTSAPQTTLYFTHQTVWQHGFCPVFICMSEPPAGRKSETLIMCTFYIIMCNISIWHETLLCNRTVPEALCYAVMQRGWRLVAPRCSCYSELILFLYVKEKNKVKGFKFLCKVLWWNEDVVLDTLSITKVFDGPCRDTCHRRESRGRDSCDNDCE